MNSMPGFRRLYCKKYRQTKVCTIVIFWILRPFFKKAGACKSHASRAAPALLFAAQPVKMPEPAPLFAAQPTKVFRRSLFSKRLERSRLKFFAEAFFQKGWSAAD
ncbi:hypothetical protein [Anaerotruncus colihominis]|uniref:hypothetical protein n=1 Tax=Anaerotruncus colihominis TaxID=169435 RepID=UPI002149A04A|nr:hypothetical protein [Anaerotruncus colihominis]MCR2026501.1 hypothetical protein [Anaerotruncus colihominis]